MDNTIDKPKYEIVQREHNGIMEDMRLYPSGVLKRFNGHNWVFAPGTAKNTYTEESGREAAIQRWEDMREAWAEGIQTATNAASEAESASYLAQASVKHFQESGNAHLLKQIREGAGWIPERNQSAQANQDGLTLTLSGSLDAFRQQFGQQYTSEPQQGNIDGQEED